jgi:hypothetical protein
MTRACDEKLFDGSFCTDTGRVRWRWREHVRQHGNLGAGSVTHYGTCTNTRKLNPFRQRWPGPERRCGSRNHLGCQQQQRRRQGRFDL